MAAATKAAKADLLGALGLCKTATPQEATGFMENYTKMKAEPPLEPMQVMDDLYFLGNYWTSAWAVKTSKGLVILDALDNADEAQTYIENGLKKLKLDPSDIKYVIVSHAHGDHYGGAAYLKKKFDAKVVMSDIDWKVFDDPAFNPKRIPLFDDPPKRDMAVKDGDTIKLGNTEFKLYVIPGHTLGTLATVVTVHDKGKAYRAVDWGGTAYNFGPLADRLQIYADTTEKYRPIMKKEKAEVLLSNHVSYDNAVGKMGTLKERKPNRAESLRGRRGHGRPLPHRARRMRARHQGLCRRGPAGQREEGRAGGGACTGGEEVDRHCERSEAIHRAASGDVDCFVASLLAMTIFTASATTSSPAN